MSATVLKIEPKYFEEILRHKKSFEVRLNDKNFFVGDAVSLAEYSEGKYTGNSVMVRIKYILSGFKGLSKDYVAFSFDVLDVYLVPETWKKFRSEFRPDYDIVNEIIFGGVYKHNLNGDYVCAELCTCGKRGILVKCVPATINDIIRTAKPYYIQINVFLEVFTFSHFFENVPREV